MAVANILAHYDKATIMTLKSFYCAGPWGIVMVLNLMYMS
jgi:hypothetical protein